MFDGADPTVTPFFVGPEAWPAFAERVQPHLARMAAGSGGRHETSDLVNGVVNGRVQLWLALQGGAILCALLTEVHQYPRLRVLRCIGVVGRNPRRWMHLMENVKRVAKENLGCERMEAMHTPGHERLLGPEWTTWHFLSECAL